MQPSLRSMTRTPKKNNFPSVRKKLLENDRAAFFVRSVFSHIFFAQFEQMVDAWRDDFIMAGTIRLFSPSQEIATEGVVEGVGEPFCVFLDSLDHFFLVVDVEGEDHRTASDSAAGELGARAPAESAQGFLCDGIVEI